MATPGEMQSHFAEKIAGFVGQMFMPEMLKAMAAQASAADMKMLQQAKSGNSQITSASFGGSVDYTITNPPVSPKAGGAGAILRFFLTLLMIAAVMYLMRRH